MRYLEFNSHPRATDFHGSTRIRPSFFSVPMYWFQKRVSTDQRPGDFEHNKSDLKGMKGNVGKNRGADGVQNVVGGSARIHPSSLVADVGNQNEQRPGKRSGLPRK